MTIFLIVVGMLLGAGLLALMQAIYYSGVRDGKCEILDEAQKHGYATRDFLTVNNRLVYEWKLPEAKLEEELP